MIPVLGDIPFRRADGTDTTLSEHAGRVVLVVNVASRCGLTPQYDALASLHRREGGRGLVVLGFPCNQFRGQEPGDDAEIQEFCRVTYGVEFPVLAKIEVNGPRRHPLYAALMAAHPGMVEREDGGIRARLSGRGEPPADGDVVWNFEKFLIGRDGTVIGHFAPDVTVDDPALRGAIETALGEGA